MGMRKEYTVNNARIPEFTSRFRKKVDEIGGVSKVAELSGISRPTLNFWYNGQRTPDAVSLITLARCFKVSSDYLLGLTDAETPNTQIRAITDFTGLSEKAVNQLHLNKQFSGSISPCASCIDGVNLLLEDVQYGNNVLGNISDYIREKYDGFLIQSDDEHIISRNMISLGKDDKPVHDINIHYMKSVFLVWIQGGIIELYDKMKGENR